MHAHLEVCFLLFEDIDTKVLLDSSQKALPDEIYKGGC